MISNSYAQASQDFFAEAVLGGKRGGVFVDVGCSHPVHLSNTFALETELGWTGVLIDSDRAMTDLCHELRNAHVICADARTFDWETVASITGNVADYASVDVDEHTHEALRRLVETGPVSRVMTVEHDFYSRGDRLRIPNRTFLASEGYELIAADVHHDGCCYEDWFVRPELVDMQAANHFRSSGRDWREFFA